MNITKRSLIISILLVLLCFNMAVATPLTTETKVVSKTTLARSTPLTKSFKNSKVIKAGETVVFIRS